MWHTASLIPSFMPSSPSSLARSWLLSPLVSPCMIRVHHARIGIENKIQENWVFDAKNSLEKVACQIGKPGRDLISQPANRFVLGLIGGRPICGRGLCLIGFHGPCSATERRRCDPSGALFAISFRWRSKKCTVHFGCGFGNGGAINERNKKWGRHMSKMQSKPLDPRSEGIEMSPLSPF